MNSREPKYRLLRPSKYAKVCVFLSNVSWSSEFVVIKKPGNVHSVLCSMNNRLAPRPLSLLLLCSAIENWSINHWAQYSTKKANSNEAVFYVEGKALKPIFRQIFKIVSEAIRPRPSTPKWRRADAEFSRLDDQPRTSGTTPGNNSWTVSWCQRPESAEPQCAH